MSGVREPCIPWEVWHTVPVYLYVMGAEISDMVCDVQSVAEADER